MAELIGIGMGALPIALGVIEAIQKQLRNYKDNPGKVKNLERETDGLKKDLIALKQLFDHAKEYITVQFEKVLERTVNDITERLESLQQDLCKKKNVSQPSGPKRRRVGKKVAKEITIICNATSYAADFDQWTCEIKEERGKVVKEVHYLDSIVPKAKKYKFSPPCLVSKSDNAVLYFDNPDTSEGELRSKVLKATTANTKLIGVEGMGGVGKSTILRELVTEVQISKKFPDGRFYVDFGHDASESTVIAKMRNILDNANGEDLRNKVEGSTSLQYVIDKLKEWFSDKKVLFLLDDIWPKNEKRVEFMNELKKLLGCSSHACMIISTRSQLIAHETESVIHISSLKSRDIKARAILLSRSGILESEIEAGSNADRDLTSILDFCCGLPLTLTVAGCLIKDKCKYEKSIVQALEDLHLELKKDEVRIAMKEIGVDHSFDHIVSTSLMHIDNWTRTRLPFGVEQVPDLIRRLCIFQRKAEVPISVLRRAWGVEILIDAKTFADKLADIGLLEYNLKKKVFHFHDLIWDYAFHDTTRGKGRYQKYHNDFINRVEEGEQSRSDDVPIVKSSQNYFHTEEVDSEWYRKVESCNRPWWEILQQTKADEQRYALWNIARHLREGGRLYELAALLSRFEWIEYRGWNGGLSALSADFSVFLQLGVMSQSDSEKELRKNAIADIRLIHNAMLALWSYVVDEPLESFAQSLGTQILAHLLDVSTSGLLVKRLVRSVETATPRPWLRPLKPFWPVPDGGQIVGLDKFVKDLAMNWERYEGVVILESGEMMWIDFRNSSKWLAPRDDRRKKKCVAWSKDGKTVVVGYKDDDTLEAWDGASKRFAHVIGHHPSLRCLALSEDGTTVASGAENGTVKLWNGKNGSATELLTLRHVHSVSSVSLSRDGKVVVSGSEDGTVLLWNGKDRSAMDPLYGHKRRVTSVCVSGNGSIVASGSDDGTVQVWSVKDGRSIRETCRPAARVRSVSLSEDGGFVAFGSQDGTVRLLSSQDGRAVEKQLRGHDSWVSSVSVSGDGNVVASGSGDRTVRLRSRKNGSVAAESLRKQKNEVWSVSVSGDGDVIASGSRDCRVRIWSGKDGNEIGDPLCGHERRVTSVCVSGNGSIVASGSDDCKVRLWSGEDGSSIAGPLCGHEAGVSSVSVSGDGNVVASGSRDGTVRLWSGGDGNAIGKPFRGRKRGELSVSVSGDGKVVASGSFDGTVRLWSGEDGSAIRKPLCERKIWVRCVSVSGDGGVVAAGFQDGTVRLWSVRDGSPIGDASGRHEGWVRCVNVSGDGSVIGSGAADGIVRLWSGKDGSAIGELSGHERVVWSVSVSEDGNVIVAGCDKTLKVWNIEKRLQLSSQTQAAWRKDLCLKVALPDECYSVGINCKAPICSVEKASSKYRIVTGGLNNGKVLIFKLLK